MLNEAANNFSKFIHYLLFLNNQIMLYKNKFNRVSFFVKYFINNGKALSCKDGIIKAASAGNMMTGATVKFGEDQMDVILSFKNNKPSDFELIKKYSMPLLFMAEVKTNAAQKFAHDFAYNLGVSENALHSWFYEQLIIMISGVILFLSLLVGLYFCIKSYPTIKNNLHLFKSGYTFGCGTTLSQVKELKEYISYTKGKEASKKDEEDLAVDSSKGNMKPAEEEKKEGKKPLMKDNKKPTVLPIKEPGKKLTESEKKLIAKHHKELKAMWWKGVWWGATITGAVALVSIVWLGPRVVKDAAKEGVKAGVQEAAPHLIPAAEAGARELGKTLVPHLNPAVEAGARALGDELRKDFKAGVASGTQQAISDEIQKVKKGFGRSK